MMHSVILSYRFARQIFNEEASRPIIMVKGKDNVSSAALADELEGVMRSLSKISPKQEDNFSLNQITRI